MKAFLALREVSRHYGGLRAVDAVSLDVEADALHAVIGPNGAGKTTLFDLISGFTAPSSGEIALDGRPITGLDAWRRARLGLARSFQAIRGFADMTPLESVLTGLHAWRPPAGESRRERASAMLRRFELDPASRLPASALSWGERRRLELARALAPGPRLLLLDEPAAGLNPSETAALARGLAALPGEGVSVLLVEHDMGFVMGLARRITVLNFGRVIFDGTPEGARRDEEVREAYLGTSKEGPVS